MKRVVTLSLFLAMVGSGCLRQAVTTEAVDDLIATNVSATLAQQVTLQPPAPTQPPLTVEPPAPTAPPSATLAVTLAPTLESATATATVSATASATATATTISGDPRGGLGDPTWRDTFTNGNGWNLGEDSFSRAEVEDGKFILTGLSTTDGWRLTWPEVQDAYLEATIGTKTCQGSDEYGLIFRVPDIHSADEGYLFGFTCDGRYFLRTWDGENMVALIPATAAAAVQAGSDKTNRIGVWMEGDDLSLYANGTLLREIENDMFTDSGGFGFFIGARQTENFTTESDEIAYWDID
jgi:hypothetical protein